MNFDVFEFRGKLIIPTLAQTADGFYMMVEPVIVVSELKIDDVTAALQQARARGNPRIASPGPKGFPPAVVLPHAGVKTLAAFEKKARSWGVRIERDVVTVIQYSRHPKGGFTASREDESHFSGENALNQVAEWLIQRIADQT